MISIQSLSFSYQKHRPLFNNLQLTIKAGEVCGLLGKNGAGKTTLLKLISGLLFPTSGSCTIMGNIPSLRQPSFLADVYFLTEEPYVPALTIAQYLAAYAPFYPQFNHDLFKQSVKEFELNSHTLLTSLSYGEKKKFLLSFALATLSRLLILDEPTNGLDIPSKAQFRKLLASAINPERLVILSTHQVHDIEQLVDSVLILDEGKNIFYQQLSELTKSLVFSLEAIEPDKHTCFYYEKQLTGYAVINLSNERPDTQVDLELLFKAVLANKSKLPQLFSEAAI